MTQDKYFLFENFKIEVDLFLKEESLETGVTFSTRVEEYPDSPFNIIMDEASLLLKILNDDYEDLSYIELIKDKLSQIFDKYEYFYELDGNTLYTLPF